VCRAPASGETVGRSDGQVLAPLIGGVISFESEVGLGSTFALDVSEQVAQ
jgi:hypothetical protein